MSSLTIRNLSDDTVARLRLRAASSGHSVEQEARIIISQALGQAPNMPERNLATRIQQRFAHINTDDLKLPKRESVPAPVKFE